MFKPLDDVLVVSLEQAVAAPFCTLRLAEACASVIKIERNEGDFARYYDKDVKGESAHPIYAWALKNHGKSTVPKWNFHKILINREGKIHNTYSSLTNPTSKKITSEIKKILNIE